VRRAGNTTHFPYHPLPGKEAGLDALIDWRIEEVSHRRAPVDEVVRLQALYKGRYEGWNVRHFYERSCT